MSEQRADAGSGTIEDASAEPRMGQRSALRRYWDREAATYDDWSEHGAWSSGERAAWAGVLTGALPAAPAKLLDVGAGTGFLSLAAARLGHHVTALDVSPGMLAKLRDAAAREGLAIDTVNSSADEPPPGPFDVVMERLAIPVLPDPERAFAAWRAATPNGQLLAFEALWTGRDYTEAARRRARELLRRARRLAPEHAPYQPDLYATLPLIANPSLEQFIPLIEAAGWQDVRLHRLRDVEWARQVALPPLDRLFGVTPEFVVAADAARVTRHP